ncbi:MAG: M17 family metallopeptidase, partial [Steroidobacteraceae bacterium]
VANNQSEKTLLRQCPRNSELLQQQRQLGDQTASSTLQLSANKQGGALLLIFVKSGASCFEQLQMAAKLWKIAADHRAERIALSTHGFDSIESHALLNSLLAAVLAGSAALPTYKSKHTTQPLKVISLQQGSANDFATTLATHAGNHLARWLTTLPPNVLDCGNYRHTLQQLAKQESWQAEFLTLAALKKHKADAFLAVARANAHSNAGIMRLRYHSKTNKRKQRHTLALVGKGICFDTGGINLKPHKSMVDMHTDMQGSAVALGTLLALSRLKVPFDIECWLALTENEIGPNAYRPQEVITAANGVTIQVVHSDAEGRMALADTLTLAARNNPNLILDFATLTGACVGALTERMSGAFSNRPQLRDAIELAGRNSGERVWSFPMDSDFDSDLDSPIADIMQCTMDGKGDHILAARFLNRFVPETIPWIHIDLSSGSKTGGLAHIPTEITGFGVRWAVDFFKQHSFN